MALQGWRSAFGSVSINRMPHNDRLQMYRVYGARTLVTASAVLALAVPLVGGVLVPGHSHVGNFIGELGAVGAEWGAVVSFGGFLPIGLVSLTFLMVAAPLVDPRAGARVGYCLLSCVGVAYVGAAFAPCDLGCPSPPTSPRQLLHNLLGILEYVGGGIGLMLFVGGYFQRRPDRPAQTVLFASGATALGVFAAISAPGLAAWHGLIQWVGEVALFGSLVLIGWRLARPKRGSSSP